MSMTMPLPVPPARLKQTVTRDGRAAFSTWATKARSATSMGRSPA